VYEGKNEMETVVAISRVQYTVLYCNVLYSTLLYCSVRNSFVTDDMTELHQTKNCTGGPVW
jgi:hypothetical protein